MDLLEDEGREYVDARPRTKRFDVVVVQLDEPQEVWEMPWSDAGGLVASTVDSNVAEDRARVSQLAFNSLAQRTKDCSLWAVIRSHSD